MKRLRGLHIRMQENPLDVIEKAADLGMTTFQCFLKNERKHYPFIQRDWLKTFFVLRRQLFTKIYVHASYWINLCLDKPLGLNILEKELALVKRFECTHLVLHPGFADSSFVFGDDIVKRKKQAINNFVSTINHVMKNESDVILVLENTAHGKYTIGSDIQDLSAIYEKLDHPEKVRFCIDTAHAHAYGYNLTLAEYTSFITMLDSMLGHENIELIHLNNTVDSCGSCLDQHASLDDGIVSQEVLKYFVQSRSLMHASLILELPVMPITRERELLELINMWVHEYEIENSLHKANIDHQKASLLNQKNL